MLTPGDIRTLERVAETLSRANEIGQAIELWALILRVRLELGMPPETVEVGRG